MSDPGVIGPLADFEDRCRRLLAHSSALRTLLGADDSDAAIEQIFNIWEFAGGDDALPLAPVAFISADLERMRFSPEKNVDGPVTVRLYAVPPDQYRDTTDHARRWFINQVGLVMQDIVDLQGNPISNSSGNHLRVVKRDTNTDGFYFTFWPAWSSGVDPDEIGGENDRRTLTTEFEVHLEH